MNYDVTMHYFNPYASLKDKCDSFLISNFRRVLNVVFFLLGDSPASEFYVPTFRNTRFHFHRRCKQEEQPDCYCWGIYTGKYF